MPELPEVETVKETLKQQVIGKIVEEALIYHNNVIEFPTVKEFKMNIKKEPIIGIERRGKWLLFELEHYYLLSHLRMEGKYFIRENEESKMKHELVKFSFTDGMSLRYHDTRKFGKMHLIEKEKAYTSRPLNELGLEPFDENLTSQYLKENYKRKTLPIKTALLDQSIITGIGNIYADEILFSAHIHPLKACNCLTKKEREEIISCTKKVLLHAIKLGGTTIRSFTSSEGVHGLFQNELLVHNREVCSLCDSKIIKMKVGGRGTYYCPKCQKKSK